MLYWTTPEPKQVTIKLNTLTTVTRVGSLALDFAGLGGLGDITRAAVNVADIGSEFLLMKPFGRSRVRSR